jgi:hypothetical protein
MRVLSSLDRNQNSNWEVEVEVTVTAGPSAAMLSAQTGSRDEVRKSAQSRPDGTQQKGKREMSDIKKQVKEKIDDAADATKKALDKAVDKSKDMTHEIGKRVEKGGKRLQDA